jgi:hypothetical protein
MKDGSPLVEGKKRRGTLQILPKRVTLHSGQAVFEGQ